MPIDYVCPHCHAKFFVDDAYRGQSGPCAECGKTISIPGKTKADPTELKSKEQLEVLNQRARNAKYLRWSIWAGSVAIAVTISYLLAMIVIPEVEKLAIRRDATKSLTNLQRVAKALNEYAAQYGSYPPPTVMDSSGMPLYSWRVLILPQLGHSSLYSQFRLDKAWDAPENVFLQNSMPEVYRLTGVSKLYSSQETAVSLVTGPGTLFPATGPLSPKDVKDNASATILVTEAVRASNIWSSPGDCLLAPNSQVGATSGTDIGTDRQGIALAVSVAENSLVIPDKISVSKLRGLATPDGGEIIDPNEYSSDMMKHYIKP